MYIYICIQLQYISAFSFLCWETFHWKRRFTTSLMFSRPFFAKPFPHFKQNNAKHMVFFMGICIVLKEWSSSQPSTSKYTKLKMYVDSRKHTPPNIYSKHHGGMLRFIKKFIIIRDPLLQENRTEWTYIAKQPSFHLELDPVAGGQLGDLTTTVKGWHDKLGSKWVQRMINNLNHHTRPNNQMHRIKDPSW